MVAVQDVFLLLIGGPPSFAFVNQIGFLAERQEHDQYYFGVLFSSLFAFFLSEVAVVLEIVLIGEPFGEILCPVDSGTSAVALWY